MANDDKVVCIAGNKYRIVEDATGGNTYTLPQQPTVDMSVTESKLTRIVDIIGGGNIGGGYRSVKTDIPAREQSYPMPLGLHATQVNIRADQAITLKLNSTQGDDIFIEVSEFPLSISDLSINESIHTLFITTGDNQTRVKVLAFGLVG
jgi:hypothetical protein